MIISESLIELNLRSTNKTEIIEDLAIRAKKAGRISDINGYMQAVSEVENRHPTVLGYGIAMPYGKSSYVEILSLLLPEVRNRFVGTVGLIWVLGLYF